MQKIVQILQDIRPEFDFTNESDFINSGMLDSFDVLTLVTELEESFGILIDGEDIVPENFANIQTIQNLVEKSK